MPSENEQISDEVKRFICEFIGSVQQLEVLLVLYRDPQKEWTVNSIDDVLKIGSPAITNRLIALLVKGLITKSGESNPVYRFQPKNKDHKKVMEKLSASYFELRLQIIELISAKAEAQIKSFSDAFRIRGEKKNG